MFSENTPQREYTEREKRCLADLKRDFGCDIDCENIIEHMPDYNTEFIVNGREYVGYKSLSHFKHGVEENPSGLNCSRLTHCVDRYGQKVIVLSRDIPCFDFGDREYDSSHRVYFFSDRVYTHALYVCEGYKVASLTVFKNIKVKTPELKAILDKEKFPAV